MKGLTQTEAAERLRISTSWLRVLTDRGIVTRSEDGSYPWPQVAEEFEAHKRSSNGADDESSGNAQYEAARTRKVIADAELRETELAVRRGELIPIGEVLDKVRKPLEEVDARLRSAPRAQARMWARKLGVTQAEAIAMLGEITEAIRADLRKVFDASDT